MNKICKIKKIIFLLMFFCVIGITLHNNISFAISLTELETQAGGFISKGASTSGSLTSVTTTLTTEFQGIGQILTSIGTGVVVAVITFMGIKYIISPPDKQAALKQQLIGVALAAIVIYGSVGIWKAAVTIASNF